MTFLFSSVFGVDMDIKVIFRASLQAALMPDITRTSSFRNVISIEHTTGAVFVLLFFVFSFFCVYR